MSANALIKPVATSREHNTFVLFPYTLYKKILKNPYWAGPLRIDEKTLLNTKKHPFYKHAQMQEFLAYKGKQVVGRIAGIIDSQYHKYREKGVGYFGFFECINDKDAAFGLFDAALDWARSKGMKKMIGPISPSTNNILGLLLNDFEGVPMIQVPYNPDYYPKLYNDYGFEKEKDHLAFIVRAGELTLSEKIQRVVNLVRNNKRILLRKVNMKNYAKEVKIATDLYNKAWIENSDFVPWTDEEFSFLAKDLKLAIIPELTFLAFVDGKPAGVSIALYNFNEIFAKMNGRLLPTGIFRLLFGKKKLKSLRLAIMGVLPEYRRMGIDSLFTLETYDRGTKLGFDTCEMSLILEDNQMLVNMLNKWGSPVYRTYRVFRKALA